MGIRSWPWLVLCVVSQFHFVNIVDSQDFGNVDNSSQGSNIFGFSRIPLDKAIPGVKADDDFETWIAPVEYRSNFPFYLSGFDSQSRPIWIVEFGKHSIFQISGRDDNTKEIFEKYLRQISYIALKSTMLKSTAEKPVHQFFLIMDYENSKLRNAASPTYLAYCVRLARMYRQYLDEHVAGIIVINASPVAVAFVNILRPFFGGFLRRVQIYGANKAIWRPQLLELFPKSELPKWYGGLRAHKPIIVVG